MAVFQDNERVLVELIGKLGYCNPFTPQRIELERAALGRAFDEQYADWNLRADVGRTVNVNTIIAHCDAILTTVQKRLRDGATFADAERVLYEDLALFVLYHRYVDGFDSMIAHALSGGVRARTLKIYDQFADQATALLDVPGVGHAVLDELPHIFAVFFQIRRAFAQIYRHIIGISKPAARLRAAVWQSIFTHDLRRYRRTLHSRMGEITTLITGASGTGKELVARAVGLSRYIPFDATRRQFTEDFAGAFIAVNLSSLSPTLIESELFGHVRGAFTGAVADRVGWLESCPPLGAVFLDEIGELDGTIQVKLLRVLQNRRFSRLGESTERTFAGKIIAATNRDLAQQMHTGAFRTDLYYRLCSDTIVTPSLAEQLADDRQDLRLLIEHIAARLVDESEADALADQVADWIDANLGTAYGWPGNTRELEQCVRNMLVRGRYDPPVAGQTGDAASDLADAITRADLTAEQLLRRYCQLVYQRTGSYEAAGRLLDLDRRTVKAKVMEE